ncbi:MAG: F0F1 ATP synthase subunit gamma [candidate division Zixibacteria bacterium]|nr:F0F1 ATP synthase subunit gamma [candidate division Zixibacteria bacterium]
MATLRDIRKRIRSVVLTRQITNTMMMVAAAKLRRAQTAMYQTGPFADQLDAMFNALRTGAAGDAFQIEMIRALLGPEYDQSFPVDLAGRRVMRRTLVLFTSDRGLCGAYNANAINAAHEWLKEYEQDDAESELVCVGRRGARHFEKTSWKIVRTFESFDAGFNPQLYWDGYKKWRDLGETPPAPESLLSRWSGDPDPRLIQGYMRMLRLFELREYLVQRFANGLNKETFADGTNEIQLSYTHYISPARSRTTTIPFLSIEPPASDGSLSRVDYIFEPDVRSLLTAFMPLYADLIIWAAAAHSQASEQAMRVVAMTMATDLAEQLIRGLTLSYNKARQAAITTEILEVNTGAEALRA